MAIPANARAEQKVAAPTLSKRALEDSTGSWLGAVDAAVGTNISFRCTGTLPQNLDELEDISYWIVDTHGAGLSYVEESARIILYQASGETLDVTEKLELISSEGTFCVGSAHLRSALGGVSSEDKIELSYEMSLTPKVEAGLASANANYAHVAYGEAGVSPKEAGLQPQSNSVFMVAIAYADTAQDELSQTPDQVIKVYTWALKIVKTAQDTQKPLAGAKFRLQDKDSKTRYAGDGWVDNESKAITLTTGDDGTVLANGLDSHTYVLEETSAPEGYKAVSSVEVSIQPTPSVDSATALAAEVKGDASVVADAKTGLVTVSIADPKSDSTTEQKSDPSPEDNPEGESTDDSKSDDKDDTTSSTGTTTGTGTTSGTGTKSSTGTTSSSSTPRTSTTSTTRSPTTGDSSVPIVVVGAIALLAIVAIVLGLRGRRSSR